MTTDGGLRQPTLATETASSSLSGQRVVAGTATMTSRRGHKPALRHRIASSPEERTVSLA